MNTKVQANKSPRRIKSFQKLKHNLRADDCKQSDRLQNRLPGLFKISLDEQINPGEDESDAFLETISDNGRGEKWMLDALDQNQDKVRRKWEKLLDREIKKFSERDLILWNALLESPRNRYLASRIAEVSYNEMTAFARRLRRRLGHVYEALKKLHGWH